MTKKDIIKEASIQTGISQNDIQTVLESILHVIRNSLNDGKKITIHNFGTFHVKEFGERNAWNPRDGIPTIVPARKVVKFKSLLNKRT